MKVVTVVGARPQFVKAAAVSREIAKHPGITEIIVHTGQHFDRNMSEIFFHEMEIPEPHYCLEVHSLSHGAMTGRMLEKIEEVLVTERPDFVMVYGDTNSTLAGALAAKKLHIRVIHVEAGLRSFNMRMPEEINRVLTDRISDILCCPTDAAMANLDREGFFSFPCSVMKTGDVMLDAAQYYRARAAEKSDILNQLGLAGKQFALCTIHRAENTDDLRRLSAIINALNAISGEMAVVLPLHPRTARILAESNLELSFDAIDPVGYFDMLMLLDYSAIVLTDSGGVQKEAFFFGKPCVTLRDETEWVELVEQGVNVLARADTNHIRACFADMLQKRLEFPNGLYGNGDACRIIVESISL
jgi:UDP-GlcNAc3NAcA epimerase